MSLLILADDLTGAADCAARCHSAGMPATICVQPPAAPLPPGAVACTSDSRHLPPAIAARRVRDLAGGLRHLEDAVWYKKIDSTLRGNIGAELDALLDALDRSCAVVCPAFPGQRRGLHDGYLVCAPPLATPPHLPSLLARQSRRRVAAIPLGAVHAGADHLAGLLATHAEAAPLLVIDALTDADLHTILTATSRALPGALLCGSAGLAGALAAAWPTAPAHDPGGPALAEQASCGPALLVVGSGSPAARQQNRLPATTPAGRGDRDRDRRSAARARHTLPDARRVARRHPAAPAGAAARRRAGRPRCAGARRRPGRGGACCDRARRPRSTGPRRRRHRDPRARPAERRAPGSAARAAARHPTRAECRRRARAAGGAEARRLWRRGCVGYVVRPVMNDHQYRVDSVHHAHHD